MARWGQATLSFGALLCSNLPLSKTPALASASLFQQERIRPAVLPARTNHTVPCGDLRVSQRLYSWKHSSNLSFPFTHNQCCSLHVKLEFKHLWVCPCNVVQEDSSPSWDIWVLAQAEHTTLVVSECSVCSHTRTTNGVSFVHLQVCLKVKNKWMK